MMCKCLALSIMLGSSHNILISPVRDLQISVERRGSLLCQFFCFFESPVEMMVPQHVFCKHRRIWAFCVALPVQSVHRANLHFCVVSTSSARMEVVQGPNICILCVIHVKDGVVVKQSSSPVPCTQLPVHHSDTHSSRTIRVFLQTPGFWTIMEIDSVQRNREWWWWWCFQMQSFFFFLKFVFDK